MTDDTCAAKKVLLAQSSVHLFIYYLWLLLCDNSRVELLQQRLSGSQKHLVYHLALYRKCLLTPGLEHESLHCSLSFTSPVEAFSLSVFELENWAMQEAIMMHIINV